MLNRSVTQLRPQITDILQSITQLLQQIRQIRTQFKNEITIIRGRLTQQHGVIVNVIIESRDTAYRVELGRLVEYLTDEERLLQAQLSTQVHIFIQNKQTHLAALRQYENQHRQTIETNPEGNQFFPKITNATFWSHVYRKVANDPNQLNTNIRFNQSIQRTFADFEISRKIPGTEQSSKCSRRKKRRLFRQQHQEELRPNEDVRRAVVAYGDASIRGTYKGNTPIPVKLVQRAVASKAVVITVDEFRTSVTCCYCRQRLQNIVSPLHTCNHRKKKHRSLGSGENMIESRSSFKCYDDENHILNRTSQCPERRLSGNRVNYRLKLCPQCPVNNGNRLYWNRDVNAAANIRSILVEYIRQGFNLDSRPVQLSRGQQDQGL
ncbi:hypothetical protein INT48_007450 [Thamnidium elegans]|uniref:Uncharacterized protein n=1 Tax=Thamnidium elegans TaxID=101142 RepID=A0A8H7VUC2_9FUNG|nr:hypothetical protein INT48_007450 [Thamnidium elegans]